MRAIERPAYIKEKISALSEKSKKALTEKAFSSPEGKAAYILGEESVQLYTFIRRNHTLGCDVKFKAKAKCPYREGSPLWDLFQQGAKDQAKDLERFCF